MTQMEMIGLAVAAQRLRIAYQDAHRLLLLGRLTGEKRGGRWFVDVVSLEREVREREKRRPAPELAGKTA